MGNMTKTLIIAIPLMIALPVWAISVPTSNMALMSNGTVEVQYGSTILGDIAGTTGATVHNNVLVTGSAYTGGAAWVDSNSTITGSLNANGSVSTGQRVSVGGDVTSGGTTWLDNKTTVGGNVESTGGISTGTNVNVAGDVNSGANIWLNNNTSVGGNASPGIGGSLTTGSGVTIGGNTTPSNPTVPTVSIPSVTPGSVPSYSGSGNTWLPNNSNVALAPGTYGSFSTGTGVDLFFTAGEYNLGQTWLNNNSTLNFDTSAGDITLNLFGDFTTGNNVAFDVTGDGQVYVNMYNGYYWMGQDATIDAIVRIYSGSFGVDSGADITGNIWAAGNIYVGTNSNVTYQGDSPVPGVPEPLTVMSVFFATGGLGGYLMRRLKKSC